MAGNRIWMLRYVAGNPAIFDRIVTDADSPLVRKDALSGAELLASNGWRVWVEHIETGKRIFESPVELAYKQASPQG